MIEYYSSTQIKESDQKAIAAASSPWQFISRAGRQSAELIYKDFSPKSALIFCGKGNNGRDGLICAITLASFKVECSIVLIDGNIDEYQKIIHDSEENVKVFTVNDLPALEKTDIIVDAILGIGQKKGLGDNILSAVKYINSSSCIKVCLDVPTGIDCDTGCVAQMGVRCHKCYTFSAHKPGLYIYPAKEYWEQIQLIDLGISVSHHTPAAFSIDDISWLPKRTERSNKGSYGRVVCFAGCESMCGAAYFAAKSSYLCGAGLVEIVTHISNKHTLSTLIPEAVFTFYDESTDVEETVTAALMRADSVVVGCGLGTSPTSMRIVRTVCDRSPVYTVYDADAINIIAGHKYKITNPEKAVFTPHFKELSRLTGHSIDHISSNIKEVCTNLSEQLGVICVGKDANTVITQPKGCFYINLSGNNGMSTAGSGDLLAGIIAGLLGYRADDLAKTVAMGVYIHGKAGDIAASAVGKHSLIASDIMSSVHKVFMQNSSAV